MVLLKHIKSYSKIRFMKKIITSLLALCAVFMIISCNSTKVVPEDYTAAQIIQLGQNAYDSLKYADAEFYYNTVLERFSTEPAVFVEAKYELGHIYMKTKRYDKAKACFTEILEYYDSGLYGMLPGAYKKLAILELERIPE